MQTKKILLALFIILVAVGGFIAGLKLLEENQGIEEKAAVPGGQATVSIEPSSGNFNVNQTINASVQFDTANIAVSGVAVRLSYNYSGTSPEVTVANEQIVINQNLLGSGDWTCPTKSATQQSGKVVIDIACANTSASGFTSSGKTLLANISMKVNRAPTQNPLAVQFDPSLSIITQKSNGQDILLIPTSTGSYTIAGGGTATTPTPTTRSGTATPTKKVTATPTSKLTVTPTVKLTGTPTSSITVTPVGKGGVDELPDAGTSLPTIVGVGMGVFAILGAIILAL